MIYPDLTPAQVFDTMLGSGARNFCTNTFDYGMENSELYAESFETGDYFTCGGAALNPINDNTKWVKE